MSGFLKNLWRFLYGVFAGLFISMFWAILLTTIFSNLYIIGILFKPIPAELLAGLLWALAYGRFLVYLRKHPKINFAGYIAGSIVPLFLAVCLSTIICFVRTPFRDGIKTIKYLEQYKESHGSYPENIEQINYSSSADYAVSKGKDAFDLTYRTGLFESTFYDSNTHKWRGDLPVGGIPYDILGIEQMIREQYE